MPASARQIATEVERLVSCLRSLDGDDRDRGLEAAQIIGITLDRLRLDFSPAVASRLLYDIGGKGVQDWRWTDVHRKEIERLCADIFVLVTAP